MRYKNFFYVSALAIFFLVQGLCAKGKNFTYESFTLKNGMQIVVLPNTRAPVVFHSIWYKVGGADSSGTKTGLAHFLEHMMFKGTKNFPKDSYKQIVSRLGGDQGAYTTEDYTSFYVTIAKQHLETVMELESDRIKGLLLDDNEFNQEKGVILQERRSTVDSIPERKGMEASHAGFFWRHTYGNPIVGFEDHIKNTTLEDIKSFYEHWYDPANAILIIAGDVDPKAAIKLAEKFYGSIEGRAEKFQKRERPAEPTHGGSTIKVEVRDPQVRNCYIHQYYNAPNRRPGELKDALALRILPLILSSHHGRLKESLLEDQNIIFSVESDYDLEKRDNYPFIITVSPKNKDQLREIEAQIKAEIKRLIKHGLTKQELDNVKELNLLQLTFSKDSLSGIAEYFGRILATEGTIDYADTMQDMIKSITEEDIIKVAKEVLDKDPIVTTYLLPVAEK